MAAEAQRRHAAGAHVVRLAAAADDRDAAGPCQSTPRAGPRKWRCTGTGSSDGHAGDHFLTGTDHACPSRHGLLRGTALDVGEEEGDGVTERSDMIRSRRSAKVGACRLSHVDTWITLEVHRIIRVDRAQQVHVPSIRLVSNGAVPEEWTTRSASRPPESLYRCAAAPLPCGEALFSQIPIEV